MSVAEAIALATALGLFGYLLFALLWAERL